MLPGPSRRCGDRVNGSEPPGEFSVSGVDLAADAVIVLGFGGPEGPDEVWPFLERVAAGRGIPRERLAAVAEHYQRFGGISPINGHNRDLTAALTAGLRDRGIEIPVVLAHRNTPPYAADALASLTGAGADGDQTIVALATSAYPSYSGCRQYREDLGQGLVDAGLSGDTRVTVRKIPPFFALDGVSTAATELVLDGLDRARAGGAANPVVLFTTHSLPSGGARASGPAAGPTDIGGEEPDAYSAAHLAVAAEVMGRTGAEAPWRLVYQSRSGSPAIPWLGPDILDVIPDLRADGHDAVVVMPIGFLSDHIEVLWDLDVQAAECAAEHGLIFVRVPTVGTHPAFLDAVADLLAWHVSGGLAPAPRWATGIPAPSTAWCDETCCLPGRPTQPAHPGPKSRPAVDPSRPGGRP